MTIYQVDAFAERPFAGNPAAVCVIPAFPDDAWMQQVATEMNLSETAFLVRREAGAYDLRWFTPTAEVDLCGHATLASAHVIWETSQAEGALIFHTLSGRLVAQRQDGGAIELDLPAAPPRQTAPPDGLVRALGARPVYVGVNRLDLLVRLDSEAAVRGLTPDFGLLEALGARGVIVTAQAEDAEAFDFISRYFAPRFGIPEDPVTGSAHCCLGPYWAEEIGRTTLRAYQASRRGGYVGVRVDGDRVFLTGHAVTVLRGELLAHP